MRNKVAMGFSIRLELKKILNEAAEKFFDGNVSMLITSAIKEWLRKNGYKL